MRQFLQIFQECFNFKMADSKPIPVTSQRRPRVFRTLNLNQSRMSVRSTNHWQQHGVYYQSGGPNQFSNMSGLPIRIPLAHQDIQNNPGVFPAPVLVVNPAISAATGFAPQLSSSFDEKVENLRTEQPPLTPPVQVVHVPVRYDCNYQVHRPIHVFNQPHLTTGLYSSSPTLMPVPYGFVPTTPVTFMSPPFVDPAQVMIQPDVTSGPMVASSKPSGTPSNSPISSSESGIFELDLDQSPKENSTNSMPTSEDPPGPKKRQFFPFWKPRRTTSPPAVRTCCNFCKNNRETMEWCETHEVKSKDGITTCPVLRKYICPICNATGDTAHTVRYCPKNPNGIAKSRDSSKPTGQARPKRNSRGIIGRYWYN